MMVLFTTIIAFFSAFYTVKTALIPPDHFLAWPISFVLAAVYAFGIMVIDREIVGATSNRAVLIRPLFAVVIAIAVSYPVKLLFFEGRISNEIQQIIEEEHAPQLRRIQELKEQAEVERLRRREAMHAQVGQADGTIAVLDREIEYERRNVHCGPKCQELIAQKAEKMAERMRLVEEMDALPSPGQLPEPSQREVDRLQADIDARSAVAYDFLYKAEALERIAREMGDKYYIISGFLLLFFFMLEIVPLALKLSIGKTEYHYYIEVRTALNNQKTLSIGNLYLRQMQDDDRAALDVPAEVTDLIVATMEDEAIATRAFETRTVADIFDAHGEERGENRFESSTPREGAPTSGGGSTNA